MANDKLVDSLGREVGKIITLFASNALVEIKIGPYTFLVMVDKDGFSGTLNDTVYYSADDCSGDKYVVVEDTGVEDAQDGFLRNGTFVSHVEPTNGWMYAPNGAAVATRALQSRETFDDDTCTANPEAFTALSMPLLPIANLNSLFQAPFHVE